MTSRGNQDRPFDPSIFEVSAPLTALFVLWSIFFPDNIESVVNAVFEWTTTSWDLMFLLLLIIYGTFRGLSQYRADPGPESFVVGAASLERKEG